MDLGHEIAQRLGCSPETVAPLLEEIVRDIRRKTTRGETARLRNIGAFEHSDAGLVFKADPGLTEILNAPFAGLPAIPLAKPSPERKTDKALRGGLPRAQRGGLPSARRKTLRSRARGRAQGNWIIGIGLAIIAAGAWFLLADRMENPVAQPERPAGQEASTPPLPEAATPETALLPDEAAEHADETALPSGEAHEHTGAAADVAAAATDALAVRPAPLRGAAPIDRALGGYTIVVASETNERRARNWAEIWREQGFRAIVLPYAQDGAALYRVGVGQFDLLEEAARARDALTNSELPQDAWVLRISGIR